ncbi:MAG: histidine--tRNA ligase [Chthoniobacterales bacterium]
MQTLPGFRDFYPEDCARRDYITAVWRKVARRYGFVEYDGPVLEGLDLYRKKNSGGEILSQLFNFTDKGEREVALRPEMTPTLVRMVAAKESHYKKPLKWFSIASFFRYEKPQKGRSREFLQLNCDLLGEGNQAADAEMIALMVDTLRAFGFTEKDVVLRLSDRNAWTEFLREKTGGDASLAEFLQIIDKLERESDESLHEKLGTVGVTLPDVRDFIANGKPSFLTALMADLEARGLSAFVEVDLTIVRGLAYYTGLVFEVFDRSKKLRAVAGGGRYDRLLSDLSDGSVNLPAIGFGMGDVVLGSLIDQVPAAAEAMKAALLLASASEVYVVIADEARRPEALGIVQHLRNAGRRVDFPLVASKVGKQFQNAEQSGAKVAVVIGNEWPVIKLKHLSTRTEETISLEALADRITDLIK